MRRKEQVLVWVIVVADCHDKHVGLYASQELAESWLYYFKSRGAQAYEIRGPIQLITRNPQ